MRWLPIVCGSLVAWLACRAEAAPYWYPPWDWLSAPRGTVGLPDELTPIPIDAVPWTMEYCLLESSDDCIFRATALDGQTIPATVTTTGKMACEASDDSSFGEVFFFVRSFAPDEPLVPGQDYALTCGEVDLGWVRARASTAPSAPPGTLTIVERKIRQDDPACNSPGDYLDVRLDGLSGAYLDEGGYVELVGPLGETYAIDMEHLWISLPLVAGTFRFTPVAADGTRGETVEVDADSADKEAVYVSCNANPRGLPLALWLLAPLVWAGTQTRRGRRQE